MIADNHTRKTLITPAAEIRISTMAAVEISSSIRMIKAMHEVTRITTIRGLKLRMIITKIPPITRKNHATSIAKTTLHTIRLKTMANMSNSSTQNTMRTLKATLISIAE